LEPQVPPEITDSHNLDQVVMWVHQEDLVAWGPKDQPVMMVASFPQVKLDLLDLSVLLGQTDKLDLRVKLDLLESQVATEVQVAKERKEQTVTTETRDELVTLDHVDQPVQGVDVAIAQLLDFHPDISLLSDLFK